MRALEQTHAANLKVFDGWCAQGIPVLVSLVEDRFGECGYLTHTGIKCVWHVLELHGAAALNHLCRLLAADGFPFRLLRALNSIATDMLASPTALQVPFYFRDPVFNAQAGNTFPQNLAMVNYPLPALHCFSS